MRNNSSIFLEIRRPPKIGMIHGDSVFFPDLGFRMNLNASDAEEIFARACVRIVCFWRF
jgi:hypothetical protein